jgi:hypothetical protein
MHVALQESVVHLCTSICRQGETHARYVQQPDVFMTIARAFTDHPGDAKLQDAACETISHLLNDPVPSLSHVIRASGLVDAFVKYLTTHVDDAYRQSKGFHALLCALRTASKGTTSKKQLENVVTTALGGMRANKQNCAVLLAGCDVLGYIMMENTFLTNFMWKNDAIHVLLTAMDTGMLPYQA